ncbi:FtsX-like permease family protein [Acidobacterium sp. S8]|uniref:FtsX-like permease family protein n=1 Tax=Acidobacterium sp. S8 TaxID=1641854 RepID=UPI0020B1601F|nr:FtsX-like permease family protein [Acidobacterium sp. S8]
MHWNNPNDWKGIESREGRAAFVSQIRQKIASIPGVISVAVGTDSTPPYSGIARPVEIFGRTSSQVQEARVHLVSPEFFSTLRIPLAAGRLWDQTENARGDSVAIVNEAFVQQYWPNVNPLGQQFRMPTLKASGSIEKSSEDSFGWRQVIGVIADLRNDGVDRPAVPAVYVPYTTFMAPYAQFDIRTQGEPLALLHSVREAVQAVAPDQQVSNGVSELKDDIERDAQWTRQRLFSILFGFFSGMALILALVGLFSVVSYSVAQRTSEFGVRIALGASRRHVLWVAARVALLSVSTGITIGILIDLFLGKILAKWMENTGFGSRSLLEATLLLFLCAIAACLLPAQRAASVHPVEALRYE